MATDGIRGKLREVQRVCEDSSEAVPSFGVIELAYEDVEAKRKNAATST